MLSLNYRDGRPIYEQVRGGPRRLLLTRGLPPGGSFVECVGRSRRTVYSSRRDPSEITTS